MSSFDWGGDLLGPSACKAKLLVSALGVFLSTRFSEVPFPIAEQGEVDKIWPLNHMLTCKRALNMGQGWESVSLGDYLEERFLVISCFAHVKEPCKSPPSINTF